MLRNSPFLCTFGGWGEAEAGDVSGLRVAGVSSSVGHHQQRINVPLVSQSPIAPSLPVSEVVPSLPNMSVGESNFSVPGDGYTTASASLAPSSSSQPLEYVTARMIEKSREQGWSELKDPEAQVAGSPHGHDNLAIWEELKRWDPRVFTDYWNVRLKLGRLIAEGGQAQVFEASMHGIDKYAAKVYKMEGFSLADLQRQWPVATKAPQSRWAEEKRFVLGGVAFGEFLANCSEIKCGTFLWDGRFAFVMLRYWGDLRTLVDLKLSRQLNGPPFSHYVTVRIMHNIAQGMRGLHARGVLHRDLKAANVLVEIYSGDLLDRKFLETDFFDVVLADFESSMLVQGTGFWRAPEVLQELLKQPWDRNPQMWTEKVDVYSYAMTCYEVLTGHLPFYGYSKSDWQRVIDGERPHLPNYVDPTLGEIVERCWHRDPSERPAFEVIANQLATIRLPLAQKMIDAGVYFLP